MAAKLKTFITSDGLTEYVVATSSRPKALAAWGVHQDLFKTGQAREVDDPELVAAAARQPGEVLERPTGGRAKLARLKPRAKQKGPSAATLKRRAEARAALERLEEERQAEVADFEREQEASEARRRKAEASYEKRRAELIEKAKD
jgi:hypothetical protein